jgi:cobalt/nickel transport protein
MARLLRFLAVVVAVLFSISSARAHYTMLLPDKHSVKKGEEVTFTYQWGHPFEHQLFDASKPESVYVLSPDEKKADLTKTLEKAAVAVGNKREVSVYRFRFKPENRGDYVFVLKTPPIWMEEEKAFVQDSVKVVLHVQTQKGWDATENLPADAPTEGMEISPLTRPYGLQPGMVFQAQVWEEKRVGQASYSFGSLIRRVRKGLDGLLVEFERYNAAPPKDLPSDEQTTHSVKTDPNGVATSTLTDAGWWGIAAQRDGKSKKRDGSDFPLKERAIHWVFVDDKPATK